MKKLKNISAGTWARLAILAASMVNIALSMLGRNPIDDGSTAYDIGAIAAACASAAIAYWKNNSFTEAAVMADKVLEELRKK